MTVFLSNSLNRKSDAQLQVFYSGGECNPLIATSDIILRLIELFQHGTVDGGSLLSAIADHVPSLTDKLRFHNLGGRGEDQNHTAPVVNLDIDLTDYVKKPTYYILSRPKGGRASLARAKRTAKADIFLKPISVFTFLHHLDRPATVDILKICLQKFARGERDTLRLSQPTKVLRSMRSSFS